MKRIRLPTWDWYCGPVMLLAFALLIAIVVGGIRVRLMGINPEKQQAQRKEATFG